MWEYNHKCKNPTELNNGNEFTFNDVVTADIFNTLVQNLLYIHVNMEV